jgi:hypothetical protein
MERYWIEFTNADREVLFRYSTVDSAPELDLPAVLSVCDFIPESSPELVYSMEMGHYNVDVASCLMLYCVFVVDRASITQKRATPLIPLSLMIVLSLQVQATPVTAQDFSSITLHPNPVELCFGLFSAFADGDPVQYYGLVSLDGNVYSTFGNFQGSPDELCLGWGQLLEVIDRLEDQLFVMTDNCSFVAVVNFLPSLKFCVFFDGKTTFENAARAALAFHERTAVILPALIALFSVEKE